MTLLSLSKIAICSSSLSERNLPAAVGSSRVSSVTSRWISKINSVLKDFALSLADPPHGEIVVRNHSLAAILWRPTSPEHFLCNSAGRRCAFKLARGNRFFDQGTYVIFVFCLWIDYLFRHLDLAAQTQIDFVELFRDRRHQRVTEQRAIFFGQRHALSQILTAKFEQPPPLRTRQTFRRLAILEILPMKI